MICEGIMNQFSPQTFNFTSLAGGSETIHEIMTNRPSNQPTDEPNDQLTNRQTDS